MPTIDRDGVELFYTEEGPADAPAVLFSHGFLMDHTMFDPQVEELRDDFRCIRWDERGFGASGVGGPFTYWDAADDAVAVLDAVGAEKATFVGMSQGGFLSLRAALAHPDRVEALVLIDTQAATEDPEVLEQYEQMTVALSGDDEETRNAVYDIVAGLILGDEELEREWKPGWYARDPQRIVEPGRTLLTRDDITDRLGEITCPALIIHGEADQAIPMEKAELLADRLPGATDLVRVPGAAHAPNLTHPDAVNPPLRAFLEERR